MTDFEKITELIRLLDIKTDEDDLLTTLLRIAAQKIIDRAYPYDNTVTAVPQRYEMKQIEIVVYLYNKRGAEGETVHNENGINRTYESADVPESMLRGITPFVKVV
jgi:type II secretory ATPase GspE/PulE/Tfp pilus assembly ATPase PilB-like protein